MKKKNIQKKLITQIELSQKSILSFPFMEEKMIGNSKPFQAEHSLAAVKTLKIKSLQKMYALKEKIKIKADKKKINWKTTPLPLVHIKKACVNKIFLRYLRVQNITPPLMGFYKFYLGEGNNAQIVRQALKNRGYWLQVQSLAQKPNFVWTQQWCQDFSIHTTKIQIFRAVKSFEKSINQGDKLNQFQCNNLLKYQSTDHIKACQKILTKNAFFKYVLAIIQSFKKGQKISIYQDVERSTRTYMNQVKAIKLSNVETVKIAANEHFEAGRTQKQYFKSTDFRIHNHLRNSCVIGQKKGLFNIFLEYCETNQQNIHNFMPATINVKLGETYDEETLLFLIEDQIIEGPWLIKPGEDSNRGHGIKIMQTVQELVREVSKRNQQHLKMNENSRTSTKEQTLIIQKYIEPFLYERRKFDIRMWVLWAKNQLWWYREGYLRTSSKQFNLSSSSKFVHLTNDAVQISNGDYGKFQSANKLSFSQFQRHLQNQHQTNSRSHKKGKFSFVYQQMKDITKKLFMICHKKLHQNSFNFELFGLDFIVDKELKVWLIECNTNPSLEIHCSLQSRLVPNLVENLLTIVIDPIFQCPQKRVGRQSLNTNWNQQIFKFQLLIDADQQLQ